MLSAMYNQRDDRREKVGSENTTDPKKTFFSIPLTRLPHSNDIRKEPETFHQESWEKAVAAGGIFMPGAQE